MSNKIKVFLIYVICLISTVALSFSLNNLERKNFLILILEILIFMILNIILKVDSKATKKFLISMSILMLLFCLNFNYFYEVSTPGVEEYIFSIITLITLPFMYIYEILISLNLLKYAIIIIPIYFYILYILSNLLNKILYNRNFIDKDKINKEFRRKNE